MLFQMKAELKSILLSNSQSIMCEVYLYSCVRLTVKYLRGYYGQHAKDHRAQDVAFFDGELLK